MCSATSSNAAALWRVRLNEIFRQGKDSRIITGAHLINNGKMPPLDNKGKDFFFMPRQNGQEVQTLLAELVPHALAQSIRL